MMFELSYRFERPVRIGVFLGYSVSEILNAVDHFAFDLYDMRHGKRFLKDE